MRGWCPDYEGWITIANRRADGERNGIRLMNPLVNPRSIDGSSRSHRFLEAVQALAPLIAERRGEFDADRRLPDAVFAAMADAGLFRLWLPQSLGGPELSPLQFLDVVEAASKLDGSVGWLVGNGGGMSRIGGYIPEPVAREWFADRHTFVASSTGAIGTAIAVEGGYRVAGRWPFGSGAHHASHFMVLASNPEVAESPVMCCYLDRNDVTVVDNWYVSGLRGTGSCDLEAHDIFVPAVRAHLFLGSQPTQEGLLYRMPPASVFSWSICGVPLGIAAGAMQSFVDVACRKGRLGVSGLLRDRETTHAIVGRTKAMLRAARAGLCEAMRDLMDAMQSGDELTGARANLRTATAHAAEVSAYVADMLATTAGAAAIFEICPLERAVRDVHAAVKHIAMSPNYYAVAGRLALGLDPGTARF